MKEIVVVYDSGNPVFMFCEETNITSLTICLKQAVDAKNKTFVGYDENGQIVASFSLENYRGFYVRDHIEPNKGIPEDLIDLQKTFLKELIKEIKEGNEWKDK